MTDGHFPTEPGKACTLSGIKGSGAGPGREGTRQASAVKGAGRTRVTHKPQIAPV